MSAAQRQPRQLARVSQRLWADLGERLLSRSPL